MNLAQEINEFGTLVVSTEKNVIFKKRKLKNIFIAEDDTCTVEYIKSSDEGDKLETVSIPFVKFHEIAENVLWQLIDDMKESEE